MNVSEPCFYNKCGDCEESHPSECECPSVEHNHEREANSVSGLAADIVRTQAACDARREDTDKRLRALEHRPSTVAALAGRVSTLENRITALENKVQDELNELDLKNRTVKK